MRILLFRAAPVPLSVHFVHHQTPAHTLTHPNTTHHTAGTFTKDRVRGSWSIVRQEPPTQSNAGSISHSLSLFSRFFCQINTHTTQPPLKMLHQGLRRAAHVVLTTQTATPIMAARTYTSTAFLSRPFSSQGANLQKVFEGGRDVVPNFFSFLANVGSVMDALGPAAKN